jgi:hypothetical protein
MHRKGSVELMQDSAVKRILRERAEAIASRARDAAPVGETGDYRDSIHVEEITLNELPAASKWTYGGDARPVLLVKVGVPYGRKVEAKHGVLARALGQAGG